MTTHRDLTSYGAPFNDAYPVEDPTIEQSAALDNRALEDEAQMTRTTTRALLQFPTTTAAAPQTVSTGRIGTSHMGDGSAALPVVTKSGVGRYAVTYPESWQDALGATEEIVLVYSRGRVADIAVAGHVQTIATGHVVEVAIFDMAGTLADLLDGTLVEVEAT